MFKTLEDGVAVSPQITADDVRAAASLGYTLIVCNRPDAEAEAQPSMAEIEAAAQAHGLSFLALPFAAGGPDAQQVEAMGDALRAPGKLLAYCRSGTRSATLWALARAREGKDADGLIEAARAAGYDLEGLRARLG